MSVKAADIAVRLTLWTWFHRVSFLATGIFTTIINQIIFYHSFVDPSTGFLSLPTYLGMFIVVLLPVGRTPCAIPPIRVAGLAAIDVLGHMLCVLGMQVVGSGVYQVLYSSVVCFTALFSTFILGKSHSFLQWLGIIAIAGGLALTSHDSVPQHPEHGNTFIAGILVTLLGCIVYAGSYVCTEAVLSQSSYAIMPQRLCVLVGRWGTILHIAYIGIFIAPRWETKVSEKIAESGVDVMTCLGLYTCLVLSSFLHNIAYFHLLCHTGAVSTGVLTALRAVGVFFVSGYFFCEIHTAQCLTAHKCAAALAVASGTLVYSFGSAKSSKASGQPAPSGQAPQELLPLHATALSTVTAFGVWVRSGGGDGERAGAGGGCHALRAGLSRSPSFSSSSGA